jgi:hypothetical protein
VRNAPEQAPDADDTGTETSSVKELLMKFWMPLKTAKLLKTI